MRCVYVTGLSHIDPSNPWGSVRSMVQSGIDASDLSCMLGPPQRGWSKPRWRARLEVMSEEPATNRLAQETSPYLLQHAHNPGDWYPWGRAAFDRARREKKPGLL